MITPPVGPSLFVTAGVTDMSLSQITRAAEPRFSVLVLVTYVPAISTLRAESDLRRGNRAVSEL